MDILLGIQVLSSFTTNCHISNSSCIALKIHITQGIILDRHLMLQTLLFGAQPHSIAHKETAYQDRETVFIHTAIESRPWLTGILLLLSCIPVIAKQMILIS